METPESVVHERLAVLRRQEDWYAVMYEYGHWKLHRHLYPYSTWEDPFERLALPNLEDLPF